MHVDVLSKRKKISCTTCGKILNHNIELRYHDCNINSETGECIKNETQNNLLTNDNFTKNKRRSGPGRPRKMYGNELKMKNCSICNKSLSDNSALRKHYIAVHLKIKNFYCNICGKNFVTKQQCEIHRGKKYCIKT